MFYVSIRHNKEVILSFLFILEVEENYRGPKVVSSFIGLHGVASL